ncbi:MAG: WD40 repeat domain-containing protein [Anaerolineaceae bacterium]|nr:WD40 repeat domain-containing protein [Anaerolineaceae bacterium]
MKGKTKSIHRCLFLLLLLCIPLNLAAAYPQSTIDDISGFGIPRDTAWTMDGSRLLIVTGSTAQVYDWDGELLALKQNIESRRHPRCGVISADGSEVFFGTEEGWIERWNVLRGEKISEWKAHPLVILDLVLKQDDSLLLSIGWQSHPSLWNIEGEIRISELETSSLGAQTGAFLPDGKVALWSKWMNLQLFEPDGTLYGQRTTSQFSQPPVFSSDGSLLAGINAERVQILDAFSGEVLHSFSPAFSISQLVFSDDNNLLMIFGEGSLLTIDLSSGNVRELIEIDTSEPGVAQFGLITLAPDSTHLLFISDRIIARDLRFFADSTTFSIHARADEFIVSPDSEFLASRLKSLDYVEIWQAGESRPVQVLTDFGLPVQDFLFLPDGRLITSAENIRIWDAQSGESLDEWNLPLSSDEPEVAVCVYNTESKETERRTLIHLPTGKIAVNPEGSLLAVEGLDGIVYVLDAQSGQEKISYDLKVATNLKKLQSNVEEMVFDGSARLAVILKDGSVQRFSLSGQDSTGSTRLPSPLNSLDVCHLSYPADEAFPIYAIGTTNYGFDEEKQYYTESSQTTFCGAPQLTVSDVFNEEELHIESAGLTLFLDDYQPYRHSYDAVNGKLILQQGRYADFSVQVRSLPDELPAEWMAPVSEEKYAVNTVLECAFDYSQQTPWLLYSNGVYQTPKGGQSLLSEAHLLLAAAISPDQNSVLASTTSGRILYYEDWNAEAALLYTADGRRPTPIRALSFSSDGLLKAAGDDNGVVRIWDEENQLTEVDTNGGSVQELLFSPDNRFLAVRGVDFISVWAIENREEGVSLEQLERTMNGMLMAFSPEGNIFLTSTRKGFRHALIVWDFPSLAKQKSFHLPVTALAFASESRFYIVSDGLWVCNLDESCRKIKSLETFIASDLFIAPDESEAAVITVDGRVLIFELQNN